MYIFDLNLFYFMIFYYIDHKLILYDSVIKKKINIRD